MLKGLYKSASGMIPQIKKQEVTANNLANANTPGYKRDMLFTKELDKAQRKIISTKSDWQQPMIDQVYTDYAPGSFDKTGNPLNLAIEGDGFFKLQLPDGRIGLTRAGSFVVNSQGLLSTPDGAIVMGEGGAIEVGAGSLSVSGTGLVEVNGLSSGRIIAQTVENYDLLTKIGRSTFTVPDGVELIPVEKSAIRQGYLEESNVDIVHEMIDMMISYRAYEANAKAVQSQDQSLDHLFRRVGGNG